MYTLILPDIHLKIDKAEKIIDFEKNANKIIFLGDIFDDYNDNVTENVLAARFVKSKILNPKYIFLFGNHDLPYRFPKNSSCYCPGWDLKKQKGIDEILKIEHWKKFKYFHVEDGWLFSHAGVSNSFLPFNIELNLQEIEKWLEKESEKANTLGLIGKKHWFWQLGPGRGGVWPHGGLLWEDWEYFDSIPEIRQCVGHTCQHPTNSSELWHRDGENLCLDSNLNYYGVLENGQITIKNTFDIK